MTRTQLIDQLVIRPSRKNASLGTVQIGHNNFPCLIGRGGIGLKMREGDGITPAGCWGMGYFLYRPDRLAKPQSHLAGFPITPKDCWCDLNPSRQYNQPLAAILPGSNETLWRTDSLYDIVIVLDHNTQPSISGSGSAIFIHLIGANSRFTEGCIALEKIHMLRLLEVCGPQTKVRILT